MLYKFAEFILIQFILISYTDVTYNIAICISLLYNGVIKRNINTVGAQRIRY
jgi:hypothetical protein